MTSEGGRWGLVAGSGWVGLGAVSLLIVANVERASWWWSLVCVLVQLFGVTVALGVAAAVKRSAPSPTAVIEERHPRDATVLLDDGGFWDPSRRQETSLGWLASPAETDDEEVVTGSPCGPPEPVFPYTEEASVSVEVSADDPVAAQEGVLHELGSDSD